jgi:NADPH:quinone reductase-like Zn-dependent oxidoreductase
MKALQYARFGPPEVLTIAQAPDPQARAGQIRISVRATAINPVDCKLRSGTSRQSHTVTFPKIPGVDAAGVVDQIGPDVDGVTLGDEVFGEALGGAAAQFTLLEHFAAKPRAMSWAQAAALPAAVETAVRALAVLQPAAGQLLLINGVAGGVGLAAAQIAAARGITVIGTASATNHDFLRRTGIIPVTYGPGMVERIRELAPGGVDRALDAAGSGVLADLIALTGDPAHVVTIADPAAASHGVTFTTGAEGRAWQALSEAAALFDQGRFSVPVQQTFPLAEGAAAHHLSEQGHVRGKLVLLVD